jgi:uncharacterized protein (TIGR02466 family)
MSIVTLFPTLVYTTKLHQSPETTKQIIAKALELQQSTVPITEWQCDTFNTLGTYDMLHDPLFKELIDTCGKEVLNFSREYGVDLKQIEAIDAWMNVSSKGNYQEFHQHANSHFSLAYYLKIPKDSGKIIFKSHESTTDMFPLPKPTRDCPPAYKSYHFEPEEGMLLIFRSNLQHMVEQNKSDEPRISISMNFKVI